MSRRRRETGKEKADGVIDRREALGAMGAMTFGVYGAGSPLRERFDSLVASGQQQQPAFFSAAERAAMTVLANMIIPRDEKSGGATDAGAMPYIEFVLSEAGDRAKQAWHDGLRWLDEEATRRFQKPFAQADEPQRGQLLDDIAFPVRVAEPLRPQAEFFTRARDLVAAAFFSSSMGVADLGYVGNVFNPDWQGAPPEALTPLGLSYAEWDAKYRLAQTRRGDRGAGGTARRRSPPHTGGHP